MQTVQELLRRDILLDWLAPLGRSVRLAGGLIWPAGVQITWLDFKNQCRWMGLESVPLVTLSAIFIGIALTLSTVMELQRYGITDMSGTVITPLLLRELGPLTVSIAWCARVAARLANEAQNFDTNGNDAEFARNFMLVRLLAGYFVALPLSAYGLVIGYIASAAFAPSLGVSSMSDFMESSREVVTNRDLTVYFVKLLLINPTIAIFCGSLFGRIATKEDGFTAPSRAVTAVFLAGYLANAAFSLAVYMP
jgi:phospholipid/cholesterol/gamma-HCH transport system permease protein